MPHQVTVEELKDFNRDAILASSSADVKTLIVRCTVAGMSYRVEKKNAPVQIFTSLAAAVKKYNE